MKSWNEYAIDLALHNSSLKMSYNWPYNPHLSNEPYGFMHALTLTHNAHDNDSLASTEMIYTTIISSTKILQYETNLNY